jgi:hypothetical protein
VSGVVIPAPAVAALGKTMEGGGGRLIMGVVIPATSAMKLVLVPALNVPEPVADTTGNKERSSPTSAGLGRSLRLSGELSLRSALIGGADGSGGAPTGTAG